jgi:hypothetical protein
MRPLPLHLEHRQGGIRMRVFTRAADLTIDLTCSGGYTGTDGDGWQKVNLDLARGPAREQLSRQH